jgi:Tol biopolymer transport system component
MKRKFTVVFLSCFWLHAACQDRITAVPDFDPNGKMVFIEDCDGEGGLLDHSFGDIIILDSVSKQKIRITHDGFYDNHPSWSPDGQRIVFESIRMDTPGTTGRYRTIDLSDPRHLFILNIKTGQMTQLDRDFAKRFGSQVGIQNEMPAWSPASNQIAFVTLIAGRQKLVVMDLDSNTLIPLTTPGHFVFARRLVWSTFGDYLAFDTFASRDSPIDGVVILNVKSKEAKVIGDSTRQYIVGGWTIDGKKLILHYNEKASIYEYSIETGEITLLKQFNEMFGINGQIGPQGNELAFIGYHKSTGSLDIWLYNISSGTLSQLTDDGHEKDGLMWYIKR